MKLLAFALTAIVIAAPAAAEPVNLSPRFTVGEERRSVYTIDATQEIYGKDPANPATVKKGLQQFFFVARTKAITPESVSVEIEYEAVNFVAESGGITVQADTRKPRPTAPDKQADAMMADEFAKLVGQKLQLTLTPKGVITDCQTTFDYKSHSLARVIRRMFERDLVQNIFHPYFCARTDGVPAEEGAEWTERRAMIGDAIPGAPRIDFVYRYRLESAIDAQARIVLKCEPDLAKIPVPAGVTLRSNAEGTVMWDAKAGRLATFSLVERTELVSEIAPGKPVRSVNANITSFRPADDRQKL